MLAKITPINIVRLVAVLGTASFAVIILTVDHHTMIRGQMTRYAWLMMQTATYVGLATMLLVSVEYALVAIPFGIKLIRQGRAMRKKNGVT